MKLNNKGVTLVEIIVSVALISIVLIFLFSLLIQVNNENSDNEVKSSYLVNQSTYIKQIQEDFLEYGVSRASICDVNKINDGTTETTKDHLYIPRLLNGTATIHTNTTLGNIKCLEFELNDSKYDYAYLFLYKRDTSGATETVLSYYRGDFKQSVILEDFDWEMNSCELCNADISTINYETYTLPIIGPDYNDYSINLFKPTGGTIELSKSETLVGYTLDFSDDFYFELFDSTKMLKNSSSITSYNDPFDADIGYVNNFNEDLRTYLYNNISNIITPRGKIIVKNNNNAIIEELGIELTDSNFNYEKKTLPDTFATPINVTYSYEVDYNNLYTEKDVYVKDTSAPILVDADGNSYDTLDVILDGNDYKITNSAGNEITELIIFDNYDGVMMDKSTIRNYIFSQLGIEDYDEAYDYILDNNYYLAPLTMEDSQGNSTEVHLWFEYENDATSPEFTGETDLNVDDISNGDDTVDYNDFWEYIENNTIEQSGISDIQIADSEGNYIDSNTFSVSHEYLSADCENGGHLDIYQSLNEYYVTIIDKFGNNSNEIKFTINYIHEIEVCY